MFFLSLFLDIAYIALAGLKCLRVFAYTCIKSHIPLAPRLEVISLKPALNVIPEPQLLCRSNISYTYKLYSYILYICLLTYWAGILGVDAIAKNQKYAIRHCVPYIIREFLFIFAKTQHYTAEVCNATKTINTLIHRRAVISFNIAYYDDNCICFTVGFPRWK